MKPFWRMEIGNYVLIGVTSSLIALPVFEKEALPEEWNEWKRLREQHLLEIGAAFAGVHPRQRVLLFCHDPTALPYLAEVADVQKKLPLVEHTIIGHLHTKLVLSLSGMLRGMPELKFMGAGVRRMSRALREARAWTPFKVTLCPALAGTELLNDGGYLSLWVDPEAKEPARFQFNPLPR